MYHPAHVHAELHWLKSQGYTDIHKLLKYLLSWGGGCYLRPCTWTTLSTPPSTYPSISTARQYLLQEYQPHKETTLTYPPTFHISCGIWSGKSNFPGLFSFLFLSSSFTYLPSYTSYGRSSHPGASQLKASQGSKSQFCAILLRSPQLAAKCECCLQHCADRKLGKRRTPRWVSSLIYLSLFIWDLWA